MARHRNNSNEIYFERGCELVNAAFWSFCIGKLLNRLITIHFDKADLRPHHKRFVTQYMKGTGDWLRCRTDSKLCYVYVFENPPGGGLHVHIFMHVPLEHWDDFVRASRKRLRRHLKRYRIRYVGRILRNKGVRSYAGLIRGTHNVFDYLRDFRFILCYMLKGSEQRSARLIEMLAHDDFGPDRDSLPQLDDVPDLDFSSIHVSGQGVIVGKRSGYSESLGPSRRVFVRRRCLRHPNIVLPAREERAELLLWQAGLIFPKRPTLILPEPLGSLAAQTPPIASPPAETNARIISSPSGDCASGGGSNARQ